MLNHVVSVSEANVLAGAYLIVEMMEKSNMPRSLCYCTISFALLTPAYDDGGPSIASLVPIDSYRLTPVISSGTVYPVWPEHRSVTPPTRDHGRYDTTMRSHDSEDDERVRAYR